MAGFLSACSEKSVVIDSPIVGEWHLETWMSETPEDFDVYISFRENGSFEMYQKVETPTFVRYEGSYSVSGSVVSGIYSDGMPWSTSYTFTLSDGNNSLTMVSDTPGAETGVYSRTTIPEDVLNSIGLKSLSVEDVPRFL